jgi:drug/metabolite transporter (DMT)-like permease
LGQGAASAHRVPGRHVAYDARMDGQAPRLRVYGGLAVGVVAVSWAAIFVRLADAPALSIAAYRLVLASVPVGGYALWRCRGELRALPRGLGGLLALSGLALALHFATWIASLSRTTVASSVALVSTHPIWVALLTLLFLRERVTARTALAVALATAGGAMIGGADIAVSGRALVGDLLAVVGAVSAAVYFIIGRRVRATLSLTGYVGVVYPVAAVTLVAAAVGAGQPLGGFSARTWGLLLLLALVPQLVGHTSVNWSLRYLSAPFVSVAVLGEPVISTALAVPILGEMPGPARLAGGAITLLGVALAVREEAGAARRAGVRPREQVGSRE